MQYQRGKGPILLVYIFEKIVCLCLFSLFVCKIPKQTSQDFRIRFPLSSSCNICGFRVEAIKCWNHSQNHFYAGSHFFGTHILIPGNRELQSPTFKYKKIWSRNMAKTWLDIEGVWPLSTRGECKNMIKDHMQRWSWNLKSKEPMLRNSRGGNDPWLGALTICIKYDLRSQVSQLKIQIWGKSVSFQGDRNVSYFHVKINHDNNA